MSTPTITGVTLTPTPTSSYKLASPGKFIVTGSGFTGLSSNNFNLLYQKGGTYVIDNGTHTWGGISIAPVPAPTDGQVTLNVTPYSTVSGGTTPPTLTDLDPTIVFPSAGPYTPDQVIVGISVPGNPNPLNPNAQSSPTTVTYTT